MKSPVARQPLIERPVLQGTGFVLLRGKDQVAVAHECMNEGWSIRVVGAKFPMTIGQRFLNSRNRRYSEMTYVASEQDARDLAHRIIRRQRKPRVIDPIHRTGFRKLDHCRAV